MRTKPARAGGWADHARKMNSGFNRLNSISASPSIPKTYDDFGKFLDSPRPTATYLSAKSIANSKG